MSLTNIVKNSLVYAVAIATAFSGCKKTYELPIEQQTPETIKEISEAIVDKAYKCNNGFSKNYVSESVSAYLNEKMPKHIREHFLTMTKEFLENEECDVNRLSLIKLLSYVENVSETRAIRDFQKYENSAINSNGGVNVDSATSLTFPYFLYLLPAQRAYELNENQRWLTKQQQIYHKLEVQQEEQVNKLKEEKETFKLQFQEKIEKSIRYNIYDLLTQRGDLISQEEYIFNTPLNDYYPTQLERAIKQLLEKNHFNKFKQAFANDDVRTEIISILNRELPILLNEIRITKKYTHEESYYTFASLKAQLEEEYSLKNIFELYINNGNGILIIDDKVDNNEISCTRKISIKNKATGNRVTLSVKNGNIGEILELDSNQYNVKSNSDYFGDIDDLKHLESFKPSKNLQEILKRYYLEGRMSSINIK